MATRVSWGKILLAVYDGPKPKNPSIDTKISQISLTEAELFCHKFRCYGNQGGSGQNFVGGIRWPNPENPPIDSKISQISLAEVELQPILSQISVPWQQGRVRGNLNDTVRLAIPENHMLERKITTLSYTQPKL